MSKPIITVNKEQDCSVCAECTECFDQCYIGIQLAAGSAGLIITHNF